MDETYTRLRELGYPSLAAWYRAKIKLAENSSTNRQDKLCGALCQVDCKGISRLLEFNIPHDATLSTFDAIVKDYIRYRCNTFPSASAFLHYVRMRIHYNTVSQWELDELQSIADHNPVHSEFRNIARKHLEKHYTYNFTTDNAGNRVRIPK